MWEPDEGRYTNVSLQMIRSGDWLIPRVNDEELHLTKPPLTYWALASSLSIFGLSEWAVRLPNSIAFFLTVLLVYCIGRRLLPERPMLPAFIFATMAFPCGASNVVTTDCLLSLWETLALSCFVGFWWDSSARPRFWVLGMWAGFGLAFLTKGPPGMLPLLGILVFAFLSGGGRRVLSLFDPRGLLVFLAIGVTWYVLAIREIPGLLKYFLEDELVKRVATDAHKRHGEWYGAIRVYGLVFLFGTLPWSLMVWRRLARFLMAKCKGGLFQGLGWLKSREERARRQEELFLLCWFCLPLCVFTISRSRLSLYVLPLFVPLCLLVARRLRNWVPARGTAIALMVWLCLLPVLKWATSLHHPLTDRRPLAESIRQQAPFKPAEIVFLNKRPYPTLSFYLDCEVEEVSMDASDPEHPDLLHELGEREDRVLYVIRSTDEEEFRSKCDEAGLESQPSGGYNRSLQSGERDRFLFFYMKPKT